MWGTRCHGVGTCGKRGLIPTGVGNTILQWQAFWALRAHPHGCGEHHHKPAGQITALGSSPRVWGTHVDSFCGDVDSGLIPTGVGNTRRNGLGRTGRRAHPHGCGEHSFDPPCRAQSGGSSPRVWGTRLERASRVRETGLIPTGVGNTRKAQTIPCQIRAHPHGCGEHSQNHSRPCPWPGSSPRVWGTLTGDPWDSEECGLIPTGVGNTVHTYPRLTGSKAHPHGCGEHLDRCFSMSGFLGSSPRVWGTLRPRRGRSHVGGLIPTGVGNTWGLSRSCPRLRAHPHGCGEHLEDQLGITIHGGSSPRVWGTLSNSAQHQDRHRLIPTGVGNTGQHGSNSQNDRAHPHGCGEHRAWRGLVVMVEGSSPRVWGTPVTTAVTAVVYGLIPTGVGNTTQAPLSTAPVGAHPHGCGEHSTLECDVQNENGSSPRVWGTRAFAQVRP